LLAAIERNGTVTKLNLRCNSIGQACLGQLEEAATARPGLVLDLRANYSQRAFNPDPIASAVSTQPRIP